MQYTEFIAVFSTALARRYCSWLRSGYGAAAVQHGKGRILLFLVPKDRHQCAVLDHIGEIPGMMTVATFMRSLLLSRTQEYVKAKAAGYNSLIGTLFLVTAFCFGGVLESCMQKFLNGICVVLLSAAPALAVEPPLAPGKPAGVRHAQMEDGTGMLIVAGGALVGIGIALATADNGAPGTPGTSPTNPPTTTGTAP